MVNLEQWVGQEVLVTYSNGETHVGKITHDRYGPRNQPYRFRIKDYYTSYTKDGFYWSDKIPSDFDITKIQPMGKKEQLKQQIKALEAEPKNLEEAEKVPEGFDEEKAYEFLVNGKLDLAAYRWGQNTQEGEVYWALISERSQEPTYKDIIQLQKWIIESYRSKLGLS